MREYLFRGKRKDNGKFVNGLLVKQLNLDGSDELCIQTWKRDKEGVSSRVVEVIPETVGEFTGLTDKNGKKIFEGDIVKDIDGRFYRICLFEYEWFADLSTSIGISMKNLKPCEVIGNIFENPELFEGKQ